MNMLNRQFKMQKQQENKTKKEDNEFLELATKFNEVDTTATEQKKQDHLTN